MAGRDILRWEELCSVKIESNKLGVSLPIKQQSPYPLMKKEEMPTTSAKEPTPLAQTTVTTPVPPQKEKE